MVMMENTNKYMDLVPDFLRETTFHPHGSWAELCCYGAAAGAAGAAAAVAAWNQPFD